MAEEKTNAPNYFYVFENDGSQNKVIVIAPNDECLKLKVYYALVTVAGNCGGGYTIMTVVAPSTMTEEEVEEEVKKILAKYSEPPYGQYECFGYEYILDGLLTEAEAIELFKKAIYGE